MSASLMLNGREFDDFAKQIYCKDELERLPVLSGEVGPISRPVASGHFIVRLRVYVTGRQEAHIETPLLLIRVSSRLYHGIPHVDTIWKCSRLKSNSTSWTLLLLLSCYSSA